MAILIVLILTLIIYILNRTSARKGVACRPLSPISALLMSFVSRIRKRFLSLGLIKIFPRLLASIASMWLGRWTANGASPFGLQWVNKLKILGVYFSNGLVNVDEDNWRCKLDKLKRTLGLWSQRDLSFLGRGMILNVLGASKFWHVAKVLPPPQKKMGFC